LSDVFGRRGRAGIVVCGLALTTAALIALALIDTSRNTVWLVALIAFFLLGPYSYFAGAISLDFGGRQGSATASGFIDGVGYLGGVASGGVASLAGRVGWGGAFSSLAAVAAVTCLGAVAYLAGQRRRPEIDVPVLRA
jgi:sugar phosphate permease